MDLTAAQLAALECDGWVRLTGPTSGDHPCDGCGRLIAWGAHVGGRWLGVCCTRDALAADPPRPPDQTEETRCP